MLLIVHAVGAMVKLQMAPKILSWEKMAILLIVLTVATKMIALIVGTVAGLKRNSIFGDYFLGRVCY
jgi:hypothetical protein